VTALSDVIVFPISAVLVVIGVLAVINGTRGLRRVREAKKGQAAGGGSESAGTNSD
jgi:uncharacterized membrane protein